MSTPNPISEPTKEENPKTTETQSDSQQTVETTVPTISTSETKQTTETTVPTITKPNPASDVNWADLPEDDEPDVEVKEEIIEGLRDEEEAVITVTDDTSSALEKLMAANSFTDLNLPKDIYSAVTEVLKFVRPSKIQAEALPYILKDPPRNLLAQAVNGSGKTVCFLLGALLRTDLLNPSSQVLIILPTRELATQTFDVLNKLTCYSQHQKNLIIEVPRGVVTGQILVGTSGSIAGAVSRRFLSLKSIKLLIFDEADDLTVNQYNAVTTIKKAFHKSSPQILLFSATFPPQIIEMTNYMAPNSLKIQKKVEELNLVNIIQCYVRVHASQKNTIINDLYSVMTLGQTVIFCETRRACKDLTAYLRSAGHAVGILIGDMPKEQRDSIMSEFRARTTKIIITTNVLARGIDVHGISLVINYDLPIYINTKLVDTETYLHRIGRTGRMGRKGCSLTLISTPLDMDHLTAIQNHFKSEMIELPSDDLEKVQEIITKAMEDKKKA